MERMWGIIYCYLVLFITTCTLLIYGAIIISNTYDLYHPLSLEEQNVITLNKTQPKDLSKTQEKTLKEYQDRRFNLKNKVQKELLLSLFVLLMGLGHAFLLRKIQKKN